MYVYVYIMLDFFLQAIKEIIFLHSFKILTKGMKDCLHESNSEKWISQVKVFLLVLCIFLFCEKRNKNGTEWSFQRHNEHLLSIKSFLFKFYALRYVTLR